MSTLADRAGADGRVAGLIAAAIPLAAVAFGAPVVALMPRIVAGGVLVFLGGSVLVEWLWDRRRVLPRVEYIVVLVIVAGIVAKGFLPGVILGLVMAVVLFAIGYGRIEQVREVAFGGTYRSNVDRTGAEREALGALADRVQVLRLIGFVFFGSANALLERIRKRVEGGSIRYLVIDLRAVSGVDSSAVVSFIKVAHLAEASGFALVLAGASDGVRQQLERGGVEAAGDVVVFVPDLDRGLQLAEDGLLADHPIVDGAIADGMPPGLDRYLEREELAAGTVLMRRGEAPADVFVLRSGRLQVEGETAAGVRMRLGTVRPGVVVGEIALYSGTRTADVVAETPVVTLRLSAGALERISREDPALAAAIHRWLARTLAERLTHTQRAVEALVD
jgi:SulP family sulfate permease